LDLIAGIEFGDGTPDCFEKSGVRVKGAAATAAARVGFDENGLAADQDEAGMPRVTFDEVFVEALRKVGVFLEGNRPSGATTNLMDKNPTFLFGHEHGCPHESVAIVFPRGEETVGLDGGR
jgi:hypothetical protein